MTVSATFQTKMDEPLMVASCCFVHVVVRQSHTHRVEFLLYMIYILWSNDIQFILLCSILLLQNQSSTTPEAIFFFNLLHSTLSLSLNRAPFYLPCSFYYGNVLESSATNRVSMTSRHLHPYKYLRPKHSKYQSSHPSLNI